MNMQQCRMNPPPNDTVIRTWARLQRAQHKALSGIEDALRTVGLPPLSWYDVLLELERAGDGGLRPVELEPRMLLPQYSISRLLDRIEAAGYLERRTCSNDGRGQMIVVTRAGRVLRAKMWPVYAGAIGAAVGDKLTAGEARTLDNLLGKILGSEAIG